MNIAYAIAKLILIFSLVIEFGLMGVVTAFILAPFIALLFGLKRLRPKGTFPRRRIMLYALPLIVFAGASTLLLSTDLFLLKAMGEDPKVAGFYVAAINIAIIPYYALSALGQVLFPSVSRYLSEDRVDEARNAVASAWNTLLLVLVPISAVIVGAAPAIVQLLFGERYLPAVEPLRILIPGYIFLTIFALMANILNGAGRAKLSTILAGSGVFIALSGGLLFIPRFGMEGAALATVLGAALAAFGAVAAVRAQFRFGLQLWSILKITSASVAIATIAWLVPVPPLALLLWGPALLLLYGLLLVLFGEITKADIIKVTSQLRRGRIAGIVTKP